MANLEPVSIGDTHNGGGDDDNVDKLTVDDLPPMPDTNTLWKCLDYHEYTTNNRCKIPYNRDRDLKYRYSKYTIHDDLEDIGYHKQLYVRENLYPDQLAVFEHVTANPNDIVLLQGGPGTGKTFTMLTVGNHFVEMGKPANAVIFKRDTVHEYRFSANAFTVAQFMMRMFDLGFIQYEKLERQLSEPMSVEHFLNAVVYLTRKVTLCPDGVDFRHPLLILDLYTVKPKPFLLIIMMTLHRYRIGAVICGDKNQLQNIHNSTHAGQCTAYDIVSTFSTKTFDLSRNRRIMRCYDTTFNGKVNYVGTLSDDRDLDEWGYALVSAMFYKNLVNRVEPADTVLARNHKCLTRTVVEMVNEKKILTTYWHVEKSDNFVLPISNRAVNLNKYLKFLPLIVGNPYFVYEFSERMLCTLESIDFVDQNQTRVPVAATVRMSRTNEKKIIKWGECSAVMFSRHLRYLLNDGNDEPFGGCDQGCLYNFPLYPAFIMSIHMSMGRTIRGRVSLVLNESTYRCLYVAISRVTSSEDVNSVVIPNQLQHLVSVLLNFDVTELKPLDIGLIEQKMLSGKYLYYDASPETHGTAVLDYLKWVAEQSLSLETKYERVAARQLLERCVVEYGIPTRVLRPNTNQADDDQPATSYGTTALPFLLKMKNTITSLASLTPLESRVWIREFLNEPKTLKSMSACENSIFSEPGDFHSKFKELNDICDFTESNAYRRSETSMDFMKKTSTRKCKADFEKDPGLLKEWVIMTAAAAEDDESPLKASTTNDNTLQCVNVFIYDLVHRDDHRKDIYVLLKERLKNENINKRTFDF